MTFWSDPDFYAAAVPIVVGVVSTLGVLARWVVPFLRRVGHLVDDLTGEPARPGHAARPGVMERLATMEDRTEELVRNSGSSIKDVVHRLDRRTADLSVKAEVLDERVAEVERHVTPDEDRR